MLGPLLDVWSLSSAGKASHYFVNAQLVDVKARVHLSLRGIFLMQYSKLVVSSLSTLILCQMGLDYNINCSKPISLICECVCVYFFFFYIRSSGFCIKHQNPEKWRLSDLYISSQIYHKLFLLHNSNFSRKPSLTLN